MPAVSLGLAVPLAGLILETTQRPERKEYDSDVTSCMRIIDGGGMVAGYLARGSVDNGNLPGSKRTIDRWFAVDAFV